MDWIAVLASVFAAIAAIASAATALMLYKSRPLLIRSIEMHSEDMKGFLTRWLEKIPTAMNPSQCYPFDSRPGKVAEVSEATPGPFPLENDDLFQDLRNHLPKLVRQWEAYRTSLDSYERQKATLTRAVLTGISYATGLKVYDFSGRLPLDEVIGEGAVVEGYAYLARLAEFNRTQPNLRVEPGPQDSGVFGLWISGQQVLQARSEQRCQEIWDRIMEYLFGANMLQADLRDHQRDYITLVSRGKDVVRAIREALRIPILPNPECDLVRGKVKASP